jgi:hypothetical protein
MLNRIRLILKNKIISFMSNSDLFAFKALFFNIDVQWLQLNGYITGSIYHVKDSWVGICKNLQYETENIA